MSFFASGNYWLYMDSFDGLNDDYKTIDIAVWILELHFDVCCSDFVFG
ncbi:MAG: hypothetical protein OIF50_09550 [Flavobacteriaceae bacterium]|nr:hypothetical protein [Flavobacteriaceae bacterium]